MIETTNFGNGVVAFLVEKPSVMSPKVRKFRVKLLTADAVKDANGNTEFTMYTFVWNGRVCKMDAYGDVYTMNADGSVSNNLVGMSLRLRMSDKWMKEKWMEAECRRACDPSSERYWSM